MSAVIAQCPSCRALGLVGAVVVDGSRAADGAPRAGLPCGACGAVTWLPLQTAVSTTVNNVSPPWPSLPAPTTLPLPASSASADTSSTTAADTPVPATPAPEAGAPSSPSSASPPASPPPSTSLAAAFDDETLGRIRGRIAAAVPPHEGQQTLAERFDALLTTKWANEAEHKAVLKMAAAAGELAFVGGRYRAVLDVVRDEPRARAAQNELLTMAMATMSANRIEQAPEGTSRAKLFAAAVVMLAVGGGVFWLMRKLMVSMAASGGID